MQAKRAWHLQPRESYQFEVLCTFNLDEWKHQYSVCNETNIKGLGLKHLQSTSEEGLQKKLIPIGKPLYNNHTWSQSYSEELI